MHISYITFVKPASPLFLSWPAPDGREGSVGELGWFDEDHGAFVAVAKQPGVPIADVAFFDYKHRRRPLDPFERDATYE